MSFILDALKKSEAERRQGEVPRLQNEPSSPPPRRRPHWTLLLALALLLNGAVLGGWLLSRQEQPRAAAPPPAATAPAAVEPAVVTVVMPAQPAAPVAPAARPAPGKSAGPKTQKHRAEPQTARPKAAAAPVAEAYPPFSELPGSVRSGLPGLDLQLHFFTPEPERRLVRLNGANLREGERSGDGLDVVEITPDGIRLSHGGVRFFLPAGRH